MSFLKTIQNQIDKLNKTTAESIVKLQKPRSKTEASKTAKEAAKPKKLIGGFEEEKYEDLYPEDIL